MRTVTLSHAVALALVVTPLAAGDPLLLQQ